MKECIFKFKFKLSNVVKCCLSLDYHCPGEDKCPVKKYRDEQHKIWKMQGNKLVKK